MSSLTKYEFDSLRQRCRTNLFFLAGAILQKSMYEHVHRPITKFFVQKDNSQLPANYTLKQLHDCISALDVTKERLLLYPRGTFKSTLNVIDCVQWIINFPDIRILILTGEFKLAKAFVRQVKSYFTVPAGADLTPFQELFPEFCINAGDGTDQEFKCPASKLGLNEPTVWANSITANLSGWHCDVMKCDDVVTDENSGSDDRRDSLLEKFDNVSNLLDPHGYLDVIGTRYAPTDLYGAMIERSGQTQDLKYLCKASWTPKPHAIQKPLIELLEEDVDVLFPERQPYSYLRKKLIKNETTFRTQQLNEAVASADFVFDYSLLLAQTAQPASFPDTGFIYAAWDLALTSNSQSDYSVGVIARVDDQNRVFILDLVYGRFNFTELAYQIVKVTQTWAPKTIAIEEIAGTEGLKLEIQRQAMLARLAMPIHWFKPENSYDAKANRIRSLQPLVASGRLWFASNMQHLETLYEAFKRFTGERGKRKRDDIPDVISFLLRFLPGSSVLRELSQLEKTQREEAKAKLMYAAMYPDDITEPELETLPMEDNDNSNPIFGGCGL
jgi:predicted phage terminase large subunit-like protein